MKHRIVSWIKKQIKESGARGIVMGLSGGIDSGVVACLAKSAVGKNRLLALLLPCHSHRRDFDDAKLIARKFRIKTQTVDLTGIYDNLMEILPEVIGKPKANIKPRLRMLTLYYFANRLNYMVCGTGNKSELLAGYFTKHGDGGVDILPIGDLFKKDVRKLAEELGIPKSIITKPPTAGLWAGQTDEDEMGITYPELDDILMRIEKKRKQILAKDKINKVKAMISKSRHKREGPAICKI